VLDARRSSSEYNAGHIPGAIFTPPKIFAQSVDEEVLLSDAQLSTILGDMGITRDSKILIYDNTTASQGAAGRLFWILEYLGCTNVTVLNGGWDQWKAQGMLVETTVPAPLPSAVFTAAINPAVEYVTKEYVAEHFLPTPDNGFVLIDVRTDEEYQGSQLNGASRPGHIPGAFNFPYTKCFNADKTILNFKDLKLLLESQGIRLDNVKMVAYSTVGHRSGFFYFLCRLMGYSNVANYNGSIVDWAKSDINLYPMKLGTEP
jgi:thiosulfate/3-mercaptopyruvate sulfurtransferase